MPRHANRGLSSIFTAGIVHGTPVTVASRKISGGSSWRMVWMP
jgi:hypothetical protein